MHDHMALHIQSTFEGLFREQFRWYMYMYTVGLPIKKKTTTKNKQRNSSVLLVPKTNARVQYNTRVRVVSFYAAQGLG
jgi:hypothetical protein